MRISWRSTGKRGKGQSFEGKEGKEIHFLLFLGLDKQLLGDKSGLSKVKMYVCGMFLDFPVLSKTDIVNSDQWLLLVTANNYDTSILYTLKST